MAKKPNKLHQKFFAAMKRIGLKKAEPETINWLYAAWKSGYRSGQRSKP